MRTAILILSLFVLSSNSLAAEYKGHLTLLTGDDKYGTTIGMGLFLTQEQEYGFFAQYQDNGKKPQNNYFSQYDITSNTDPVLARYTANELFSFGVTRGLSDRFSFYFGAGVANQTGYADKRGVITSGVGSPTFIQNYTVGDAANTSRSYFATGGMLYSYKLATFQLGLNSFSKSPEIGIGINF